MPYRLACPFKESELIPVMLMPKIFSQADRETMPSSRKGDRGAPPFMSICVSVPRPPRWQGGDDAQPSVCMRTCAHFLSTGYLHLMDFTSIYMKGGFTYAVGKIYFLIIHLSV